MAESKFFSMISSMRAPADALEDGAEEEEDMEEEVAEASADDVAVASSFSLAAVAVDCVDSAAVDCDAAPVEDCSPDAPICIRCISAFNFASYASVERSLVDVDDISEIILSFRPMK